MNLKKNDYINIFYANNENALVLITFKNSTIPYLKSTGINSTFKMKLKISS